MLLPEMALWAEESWLEPAPAARADRLRRCATAGRLRIIVGVATHAARRRMTAHRRSTRRGAARFLIVSDQRLAGSAPAASGLGGWSARVRGRAACDVAMREVEAAREGDQVDGAMHDRQIGAAHGRPVTARKGGARDAAGHQIVRRAGLVGMSSRRIAGRAERHRQGTVEAHASSMSARRHPSEHRLQHEQIGRGNRNPTA